MGLVDTQHPPGVLATPDANAVCRCGHCRAVIDVPDGRRRLRCPSCGSLNAIPRRVHLVCERCNRGQPVRFSQRNRQVLCVNCAHTLHVREIELTPIRRHTLRWSSSRRHVSRRESIVLTVLLYALVLLFFLLWFSRR
jgi:DNA-directed RNA polymerase subunit RPC12/RpoP